MIGKLREGIAARVLGPVAVIAIVVVLLLLLLDWYIAPEKPGERKDLVLAAAQVLGGTALLLGLYFTWRTLQTNRAGQITERFTRAIDQLGAPDGDGNKRLEVRLGGIYALERIARDSEEDHAPIMEILTAYVREHAPWPPKGLLDKPYWNPKLAYGSEVPESHRSSERKALKKSPSRDDPDVRAVLTVLRRRSRYLGNGEAEPLDLHRTNLRGANLRGAHLEGAGLWSTNLMSANLREAHLEGANLAGSSFLIANLYRNHLAGANLSGTYIRGMDLSKALGLTQEQIDQANGDQGTHLPQGLNRPAWW